MRYLCLTRSYYATITQLLPAHLAANPRCREHLASNDQSQRHLTSQRQHWRRLRCFIEQGCLLARLALAPVLDADDLLASLESVTVALNLADELEIVVAVVGIELEHLDLLLQFVFSLLPAQSNRVVEAPKPMNCLQGHLSLATRKNPAWPLGSARALICGADVKIMPIRSYLSAVCRQWDHSLLLSAYAIVHLLGHQSRDLQRNLHCVHVWLDCGLHRPRNPSRRPLLLQLGVVLHF